VGKLDSPQRLALAMICDNSSGSMNAFSVLNSLFDPAHPSFTEEGVQTLLTLKSGEAEKARMEELAEKANQGTISADEHREYETWVRAGAFISLLQAKARLYQKNLAGPA
jgi:hypothetical protein